MEKELENSYGKISLSEWIDKKKLIEKFNQYLEIDGETLREDWQIYFNELGHLVIDYGCSCDVCGFNYHFVEQKDIMEKYK